MNRKHFIIATSILFTLFSSSSIAEPAKKQTEQQKQGNEKNAKAPKRHFVTDGAELLKDLRIPDNNQGCGLDPNIFAPATKNGGGNKK